MAPGIGYGGRNRGVEIPGIQGRDSFTSFLDQIASLNPLSP